MCNSDLDQLICSLAESGSELCQEAAKTLRHFRKIQDLSKAREERVKEILAMTPDEARWKELRFTVSELMRHCREGDDHKDDCRFCEGLHTVLEEMREITGGPDSITLAEQIYNEEEE